MTRRFGLDAINYLTDTSVAPLAPPEVVAEAEATLAESRRLELQAAIERKQRELRSLVSSLQELEAQ
jgi:hypothetical protein